MVIQLLRRPLDGQRHRLFRRFMPAEIQVPNKDKTKLYRYQLRNDRRTAVYVGDEPIDPRDAELF